MVIGQEFMIRIFFSNVNKLKSRSTLHTDFFRPREFQVLHTEELLLSIP